MRTTFPAFKAATTLTSFGVQSTRLPQVLCNSGLSVWGAQLARSSGAMADSLGGLWETGRKRRKLTKMS